MTNFPLFCACMLVTAWLDTAAHECGHWFAGRLVGIPIAEVRIGGGRAFGWLRFGPTLVVFGWVLWTGAVTRCPHFRTAAWRKVLLGAGGSIASLALVAAAAAALLVLPGCGEILQTLLVATLINALWGAGQLLPFLPYMPVATRRDYHVMREAIRSRGRDDAHEAWAAQAYRISVAERYGAPGDAVPSRHAPAVLHTLAPVALEAGLMPGERLRTGAELQRWLLSRRDLTAAERAAVLDGLATAAMLGEMAAPWSDLDAWTAELVALAPGAATARGTRGAALVLLGRPDGRALLERDLAAEASGYDRTVRQVFIARALLDEGDRATAAAMLAETDLTPLGLGAEFPLLRELRAELDAAQASSDAPARGRH